MIITAIVFNEKIPSMGTIYINDNVAFTLPKKRIDLLNLTEGKNIHEDTLKYILEIEVFQAAKSSAVAFLSLKLRTELEVIQKLNELGYENDTIERVIENLNEINYIDDYNYAQKFVAERSKLKPKSVKLLKLELSQKGVPDVIIDKAFEEFEIDEIDIAYQLLKKRYSRYTEYDQKLIHKMKTFLMSRGFSYSQISEVISNFLPQE